MRRWSSHTLLYRKCDLWVLPLRVSQVAILELLAQLRDGRLVCSPTPNPLPFPPRNAASCTQHAMMAAKVSDKTVSDLHSITVTLRHAISDLSTHSFQIHYLIIVLPIREYIGPSHIKVILFNGLELDYNYGGRCRRAVCRILLGL